MPLAFRRDGPCFRSVPPANITAGDRRRGARATAVGYRREIVLYRVSPGESCVLTTSCLLGGERYRRRYYRSARQGINDQCRPVCPGIASVRHVPTSCVRQPGARFADVIRHMQEIAFGNLDRRLAELLLSRLARTGTLTVTHQEIAVELGTAREVFRAISSITRRTAGLPCGVAGLNCWTLPRCSSWRPMDSPQGRTTTS